MTEAEEHTFVRFDKVEVTGILGEAEIIGFPDDVGKHKQVTVWYPDGEAGKRLVTTALSLLTLVGEKPKGPKPKPNLMRVPV